jgi:hypothetical protein
MAMQADLAHYDTADLAAEASKNNKINTNYLRRRVGLGGLALVLVLLVSIFVMPESPAATARAAKVVTFVHDHRGGLYLNAYLTSLTVLMAAVFLWYLRDVIAPEARGRGLANLSFAGGVLFLVGGIFSAGASFAMADVAGHASPTVLQTLNIFSQDVDGFVGGATALLIGASSICLLRSKALPRWLAYVGLVLAVASFAIPQLELPAVGVWLLLTSIVVFVTSGHAHVTSAPRASV